MIFPRYEMLHLTEEAYKLAQPLASPPVREFLVPTQLHELFCWVHGLQVWIELLMNNWASYCFQPLDVMGKPWANYHLEMQLLQDALKLARRDRGVVSNYTPGSNIGSNGGTMLWWAPLKLRHWPVSQACETSTLAKQKLNSNCCWYFWKSEIVPLRHRMPGGGSTFGDGAIRWLSPLGREELVIALSASAEKLAAMWCNGARQGLLSALDYKRGCAILLPNTTRRRGRNKVVNVAIIDRQLLLLSIMFVHRVKRIC